MDLLVVVTQFCKARKQMKGLAFREMSGLKSDIQLIAELGNLSSFCRPALFATDPTTAASLSPIDTIVRLSACFPPLISLRFIRL